MLDKESTTGNSKKKIKYIHIEQKREKFIMRLESSFSTVIIFFQLFSSFHLKCYHTQNLIL